MTQFSLKALIFGCVLASVPSVMAASVSLNGVPIDGVTGKQFKDCTVIIDKDGDINIIAEGYAVDRTSVKAPVGKAKVASAAPVTAGGTLGKRYWVLANQSVRGATEYEIELYLNKKRVRTFFSEEKKVVFEITKFLKAGRNQVSFIATKKIGLAGRRSKSVGDVFRLVIGEGDSKGRNVMITKKLIGYKRTAGETKNFRDSEVLVAR
jgi:hypothetical protein